MPALAPCPSCRRHLFSDAAACPFCRAIRPAIAAIALGVAACGSPSTSTPPDAGAAAAMTAAEKAAQAAADEAKLRALEHEQHRARTAAAVYGGPRPRPPAPSATSSAKKPCNCAPDDPLCSCL